MLSISVLSRNCATSISRAHHSLALLSLVNLVTIDQRRLFVQFYALFYDANACENAFELERLDNAEKLELCCSVSA